MKKILIALFLFSAATAFGANRELFSYSLPKGNSGLRLAWRNDTSESWKSIGRNFNLLKSDFGPWGSHKKMLSPKLFRNRLDGQWICIWTPDPEGGVTAMATSPDLIKWLPQRYFVSSSDLPRDIFPDAPLRHDSITVDSIKVGGYIHSVDSLTIENLLAYVEKKEQLAEKYSERCSEDSKRFAGLKPLDLRVTPLLSEAYPISDKLIGVFFEDLSYAADGGLYAELIRNRDFEFNGSDHQGWDSMTGWESKGNGKPEIMTLNPLHANNPHYISITSEDGSLSLSNNGFDGIPLTRDDKYNLSFYARSPKGNTLMLTLEDANGNKYAKATVKVKSDKWRFYSVDLKPSVSCNSAVLRITPGKGSVDLDMVSLFPAKTFKNRRNGLRKDLAETIQALNPRFVRFPGGCVAHGDGVDNIYDWKGSIGQLYERKPLRNIWNYHQTRGLGYYEYFQFCEDIGAEPLPVVAAGVPCQNSASPSHHSVDKVTSLGQQNGVPMEEMDSYIQDILDLIEYANGDIKTKWGRRRAMAGHPKPFNLKYIGIGNEDMITEVFESRFRMIYDAVREKYPDITVIGTVGPFYEGTDYERGWELADQLQIPIVDEHYYVDPGWLVNNRDFYDKYRRGGTKVYLGEWAAHLPGRPNNVETALAEALYLTDIERNGDVVEMTSYAPLLAKRDHTNWNPDLIYFDNLSVSPTVDYYVQKIFGNNSGNTYIPVSIEGENTGADIMKRIGISIVKDDKDNLILKMVNMLPVETSIRLDTESSGIVPGEYTAIVLNGAPDSKVAVPVETVVSLPDITLQPYSFTTVRIEHK